MQRSSAKTRRISNELFKYENEGTSEKLECYLVNHDESQMIFVKFIPRIFSEYCFKFSRYVSI